MKYRILVKIVLLAVCLKTQAQNPARSGADLAVFFYVTTFQPGWEPLPGTETDAKAIGKELADNYGFEVEYISNPTKADIENKILELNKRKFGSKDQLLLYFSMHGHFIPNANRGYLIPSDGKTPPNDPLGKSWLSYDDLGAYLSLNSCKHILLSLDACYSGAFGDRWMSYPGSVEANADAECRTKEEFAQYNDCYRYFSSGSREVRTPADSKFANRWLKTLQEGRAKKVVTTNDLRYNFGTIENPKPEGGYFTQREKNSGDFIFMHKTACATNINIAADKITSSSGNEEQYLIDSISVPSGYVNIESNDVLKKDALVKNTIADVNLQLTNKKFEEEEKARIEFEEYDFNSGVYVDEEDISKKFEVTMNDDRTEVNIKNLKSGNYYNFTMKKKGSYSGIQTRLRKNIGTVPVKYLFCTEWLEAIQYPCTEMDLTTEARLEVISSKELKIGFLNWELHPCIKKEIRYCVNWQLYGEVEVPCSCTSLSNNLDWVYYTIVKQ